ncbi:MAG: sigma-70 family RNA polymerase sigma factor [Anaerolineales bacterium]|nr:sigma-70 family RNA polymerase sigma factor [Anaerolineales bacterium]
MKNQSARDADELVEMVVEGDRRAFAELYNRFSDQVFGLARYVTRHEPTAEEVTQETFLKLWRKADTYRSGRGKFSTWLLTIAKRTAIDRLRKEDRRPDVAEAVDVEAEWRPAMSNPGSDSEEARWRSLYFALHDLPDEQRQAIALAYYQDMSHSQIAEYLGIPLGTVKTRIRLGMQKLRAAWQTADSNRSDSGESDV